MGKTKLISLEDLSLEELEVDAELIPLMTTDDEEAISKEPIPELIPILPLRNTVLFPGVVIPITATRDKSIQLIRDANTSNKLIGVVAQLDSTVQSPGSKRSSQGWHSCSYSSSFTNARWQYHCDFTGKKTLSD